MKTRVLSLVICLGVAIVGDWVFDGPVPVEKPRPVRMKKIVVTATRTRPLPLLEECWRRGLIYKDWMENRGSLTSPDTLSRQATMNQK